MDFQRLLDTFLSYVRIDSETKHEGAFFRRLTADLEAMGIRPQADDSGAALGSDANNLYAFLEGDPGLEPLILSVHMDTVRPGVGIEPYLEDGVIRSRGDTILGSDDKAGVAAVMEALRTVVERKLPHRPVQLVCTIFEEGGVRGAAHLDYSHLKARRAVVFDCDGDVGKIVCSGPGQVKIYADVTGKAAHAGFCPEAGVSAIQAAAHAVSQMRLLRIDEETTSNIGTFHAEGATNIVQAHAHLELEARSRDMGKLERQARQLLDCLQTSCDRFGAALDYTLDHTYPAFRVPEDDPLVLEVGRALRSVGIPPRLVRSGGGSDANHLNAHGVRTVVVSTGMDKVHTTSEQLTVKNLEDCARLALALIRA